MGTLVFQATLGGSVNLIGPNTASTINFTLPSADGTNGQALATNGSGTLAFSSFATLVSNTFTGSQTLSAGTANGVTYLNGSKVLTSGSALTFDGNTVRNNQSTSTNSYFRTTSGTVDVYYGAATSGLSAGAVIGTFSNNDVVLYANSAERARFNTTGAFVLAGGNTSANGIGITFPATQSASSDANTLDDYEEGSWTPAVLSGGVGITINTATYTKIGRMVYFQCDVTIASNSNASAFVLSGLPFSPSSSRFSGVSIGYNTSATAMLALIGGTNLEFYFTSGASSISNLLASGARFIVGGCYQS